MIDPSQAVKEIGIFIVVPLLNVLPKKKLKEHIDFLILKKSNLFRFAE